MKKTFTRLVLACALAWPALAAAQILNPVSDGSLYACDGCNVVNDGSNVLSSGYIQGIVKFSMASVSDEITGAVLTLNPYALPLWGNEVSIFGFGTSVGTLQASDADAGTLLGTWALPDVGYGQDVSFDVTSFVRGLNDPFAAFNIRSNGTNVFSSLEYNYGHPSQLHLTSVAAPVPEPATAALLLVGLAAVGVGARRKG